MSTRSRRRTPSAPPMVGRSRRGGASMGAPRGPAALVGSPRRHPVGPLHDALPAPLAAGSPQRADATREKLLAATHALLRERVGGTVSVNEICERAGANVAMVKYCFGSKDALIGALIERIVGGFVGELEALDRRHLPASVKLRIHVAEIVRNYVRYPYINRLLSAQFAGDRRQGRGKAFAQFRDSRTRLVSPSAGRRPQGRRVSRRRPDTLLLHRDRPGGVLLHGATLAARIRYRQDRRRAPRPIHRSRDRDRAARRRGSPSATIGGGRASTPQGHTVNTEQMHGACEHHNPQGGHRTGRIKPGKAGRATDRARRHAR